MMSIEPGAMYQQPTITTPAPRRSPRMPLLIIGLAVVVAAGVGVAAALGLFSGSAGKSPFLTFTLSGSITLIPSTGQYSVSDITYGNGTCQGTGPYSDMSPGIAVVVADPQGHTIATGSLEAGIEQSDDDGLCKLPFDVPGVPSGLASYSVTVSHRGTQVVDAMQARTGVNLTLGGN